MEIHLDEEKSILTVKPSAALSVEDFAQLSGIIDPYVQQHGSLKGLVIETQYFPGWKDIGGLIAHVKFIKNHHTKIQRIALVTDSKLAEIGRTVVGLFLRPTIKHFAYDQLAQAKQWMEEGR